MSDTLLILRKRLPENIVEILSLVTTAADQLHVSSFIVGATARDIILEYVYKAGIRRATEDVDFGVAVESWEQYERLKKALTENGDFRIDNKIEQRLWRGRGTREMKIDLIPYGGLESPAGTIVFPPTEFAMNTDGFAEAYEDALTVQITEDLGVRIVSLPGLAVLKFIAYDDRPLERQTDLQDIWFLMKNYLDAGNEERLYASNDLLNDENFDLRTVGARLLGRDMAKLLTERTGEIVLKHLSENEKENGGLSKTAEVINAGEKGLEENITETLQMLRQLKQGITEGSSNNR